MVNKNKYHRYSIVNCILIVFLCIFTSCIGGTYKIYIDTIPNNTDKYSFEYPRFNTNIIGWSVGNTCTDTMLLVKNIIRQNVINFYVISFIPGSNDVKTYLFDIYQGITDIDGGIEHIISFERENDSHSEFQLIDRGQTIIVNENAEFVIFSYRENKQLKVAKYLIFSHEGRIWSISVFHDKSSHLTRVSEKYLNHIIETFRFIDQTSSASTAN